MRHFAVSAMIATIAFGTAAMGATVTVPYTGEFDEADVAGPVDGLPAGDYDTIGGLADVGLFQLVEGTNLFHGSIVSPADSADLFLIEVLDGFSLTGASINWGTNLSWYPGIPADVYMYQNTRMGFANGAPSWFVEESSVTPEIFTISELWDGAFGDTPKLFDAPALDVGPGIYSSLLADQGGSCATRDILGTDGFLYPTCVGALDYTMTFTVERTTPAVPLPAGLPLYLGALGVAGLAANQRRKRD